jgi:hypothetical protein
MRAFKRILRQVLIGTGGLFVLGAAATSASDLYSIQERQFVETIQPERWPAVGIWVFESTTARSETLQVSNRSSDRLVVTDGEGRAVRILKPGTTAVLQRSQCGATGVLALSLASDDWPTIIECRSGLLYQIKSTSHEPNRAEVSR